MMPSILRRTGRDIERNGVPVTPRGIVSTCEEPGCDGHAVYGDNRGGKYLTWCAEHVPAGFLPTTTD